MLENWQWIGITLITPTLVLPKSFMPCLYLYKEESKSKKRGEKAENRIEKEK